MYFWIYHGIFGVVIKPGTERNGTNRDFYVAFLLF